MARKKPLPQQVFLPSETEVPEAGAVPAPPRSRSAEELQQGFDQWMEQRGKAATTRRLYLRNSAEFLHWLSVHPPLTGERGEALVQRYFAELEANNPGNSGNLRRSTAARAFLEFADVPVHGQRSGSGAYAGLRKGQGARYLDTQQILAILETVREDQDIAIVALLLFAEMSPRLLNSLRVADLSGLNSTDKKWKITRGQSSWDFDVAGSVQEILLKLGKGRKQDAALFVDDEAQALNRQSLDHIIKNIGKQAKVQDLAAYRLTMSRSKRSGQGVGWDALPASATKTKKS